MASLLRCNRIEFKRGLLSFFREMKISSLRSFDSCHSNGLEPERLAGELESRGFRTVDSLKYIKSSDLDVLFPSPHKLMMAEKRIIESEIEKVKSLKRGQLPPRELFPALPCNVLIVLFTGSCVSGSSRKLKMCKGSWIAVWAMFSGCHGGQIKCSFFL